MAVYNLSALADRTRYFESQGMSRQEAEAKAFQELGLSQDQMSQEMSTEYERLYNNQNAQSLTNSDMKGDKERLIDRNQAGSYATYDLNPQTPTSDTQATE
jgi:hypothetical protein